MLVEALVFRDEVGERGGLSGMIGFAFWSGLGGTAVRGVESAV